MNNENKVILDLETYINMLDEIKELKQKVNNYEVNYETMCKYLKEKVKNSEDYHFRQLVLEKDFDLKSTLNQKLKNYRYETIANEFIKVGITFDLIEKLTDELIKEYIELKKESESEK